LEQGLTSSSKNQPIVLIGAGGHGIAVADIAVEHPAFRMLGFLDGSREAGSFVEGHKVLGGFENAIDFSDDVEFVISLGQVGRDSRRREAFKLLQSKKLMFASVISPRCHISDSAEVGKGSAVFPGAVLGALSRVAPHCIINSGAIVEHHASVGTFSHVAPGAIVLGGAVVGHDVFIGAGAIIFQNVSVSAGSVVPAGAIIREDI